MVDLIAPALLLLLATVLAGSLALLPWDLRRRRERMRRVAPSGLVGGIDEVFHPEAHQALLVWEAEVEAVTPVPAPGAPPFPGGRIRIQPPAPPPPPPPPASPPHEAPSGAEALARPGSAGSGRTFNHRWHPCPRSSVS